jgi:hypothetical protein
MGMQSSYFNIQREKLRNHAVCSGVSMGQAIIRHRGGRHPNQHIPALHELQVE